MKLPRYLVLPLCLVLVGCRTTPEPTNNPEKTSVYFKTTEKFALKVFEFTTTLMENRAKVQETRYAGKIELADQLEAKVGPKYRTYLAEWEAIRTEGDLASFLNKYFAYELAHAKRAAQQNAHLEFLRRDLEIPDHVLEQAPSNQESHIVQMMLWLIKNAGRPKE